MFFQNETLYAFVGQKQLRTYKLIEREFLLIDKLDIEIETHKVVQTKAN